MLNPKAQKKLEEHANNLKIGDRIRLARAIRKVSQPKLAEYIGKTFQQVQKYEYGTNRVSAAVLVKIAQSLEIDIKFFFEDLHGFSKTL